MLKFACLGLKSCASSRNAKNSNYEVLGYGQEPTSNTSWRHSTQMDILDSNGPIRSRHVPNFDVYAKARTLIRQQTVSLVQHGYYNNDEAETDTNSTATDSCVNSCEPRCNCSFRSFTLDNDDESTQIPSSLVTTTTFDSMESSSSSSSSMSQSDNDDMFYSAFDHLTSQQPSQVYVCTSEFKSSVKGDLNVRVHDRVVLMHKPREGNEYLLVKSLATQKCGYVPRSCLTLAAQSRQI